MVLLMFSTNDDVDISHKRGFSMSETFRFCLEYKKFIGTK